ncbi:MAG TPA: lycopene cyclase family protein [Salegentibacter sp.]|nr:lycopene cyclase family protein [Salegentibacter sp.]
MCTTVYDFAIIGAGAAGIHLALAMQEDSFFLDKKILILEKDAKNINDKTWCFWEAGKGKWDALLEHTWENGIVHTGDKEIQLDIGDYNYKMIRSLDFYDYGLEKLKGDTRFYWFKEEVSEVMSVGDTVMITAAENSYQAKQVFDSRVSAGNNEIASANTVLQHFKGWFIETEEAIFDPNHFTMMDFRLTWKDRNSFTYLLPFSERSALVEFTFFSPDIVDEAVYDQMLQNYVEQILKPGKFRVTGTESGVIPMSDYPFHRHNTRQITKIGTAGSWVKPSSGYSFKNAEVFSQKLLTNIKEGREPSAGIFSQKHRFYDSLFLNILKNKNHLGQSLFSSMYSKNSGEQILRFLDEETGIREDLKIMAGFDPLLFMQALWAKFRA